MRRVLWALALTTILSGMALAGDEDSNDLGGGAFIAHYVADFVLSDDPCADYAAVAITGYGEQVTRADVADEGQVVFFILAAWLFDKEVAGVQFGLGDFDTEAFALYDGGLCWPTGATVEPLSIPGEGWPGPNTGLVMTSGEIAWSGNYIPLYYFYGYAYGSTTIAVVPDPQATVPFGGFTNTDDPVPAPFAAASFGALGINEDGVAAVPQPTPVGGDTWGSIKAIYR